MTRPVTSLSAAAPEADFFTVQEAAQRLRISPRTVLNRILAGELRAVREGRRWLIPTGEYYRYIAQLRGGS